MAYRYRHKKKKKLLIILIIFIAAISALALVSTFIPTYLPTMIPELSTLGYVQVELKAEVLENRGVITVTGNCYQIVAYTEVTQAESIADGLAKVIRERPNTHDLMKAAFKSFGIEVIMVKIVELRNNTYIARLVLKQRNKIFSIDCRPSDGIALAVRTNSPIYMKEDLLKAGRYVC